VGFGTTKVRQAPTGHANRSVGTLDILQRWGELLPANAASVCRAAATLGAESVAIAIFPYHEHNIRCFRL